MPPQALLDRLDVCHALRSCGERQAAALADRDYDALLAVLSEKRRLLDRLPRTAAASPGLSEADRAASSAIVDEAGRLLAELARDEDADMALLLRQRNETRDALRELTDAGRVHAAYRDALGPSTHRSLDIDL